MMLMYLPFLYEFSRQADSLHHWNNSLSCLFLLYLLRGVGASNQALLCFLCSVPCSISWFPHCWLLQILLIHLTMFPSVTVCKLHHHFLLYFLRIILLILRCPALPNWHEGWFGASFTFTQSSKLWILWVFFPSCLVHQLYLCLGWSKNFPFWVDTSQLDFATWQERYP